MNDLSLKELVASLISIAIVSLTIWLIIQLFFSVGDNAELFARKNQLIQVVIGLAGTVTGYYFGRIPAENSARVAQASAEQAHQNAAGSQADAAAARAGQNQMAGQIRTLASQIAGNIQQLGPPGGGGTSGPIDVRAELDRILRGLNLIQPP